MVDKRVYYHVHLCDYVLSLLMHNVVAMIHCLLYLPQWDVNLGIVAPRESGRNISARWS